MLPKRMVPNVDTRGRGSCGMPITVITDCWSDKGGSVYH